MDLKSHRESILHKIDDIIKTITTKDRLKLTQWHFEEERLISEDIQYGEFLQRDLFYQEPIREALEDGTRHRYELGEHWKVVGPSFRAFWSYKMTREQREGLMITCFLQTASDKLGGELRKYLLDFDYTTLLDNNGQGLLGLIENLIDQNSQNMAPALSSKLQATFNTWLEETPGDDLVPNKTSFILALKWRCTWSRTLFACKAVETLLVLWKTIAGKTLNSFILGSSHPITKSQAAKVAKKKQKKKRAQMRKLETKQMQEPFSKVDTQNRTIYCPSINALRSKQICNTNKGTPVHDSDHTMPLLDDASFTRHREEFIKSSNRKYPGIELVNGELECARKFVKNSMAEKLPTKSFVKLQTPSDKDPSHFLVKGRINHVMGLQPSGQDNDKYRTAGEKDLEGAGSEQKYPNFDVLMGDVPELLEDTLGENRESLETTISPVDTPLATTPICGQSPSIGILGDEGEVDSVKMIHSVASLGTTQTCPTALLDTQKPSTNEEHQKRAHRVFVAVPLNLFKKKKEVMAIPELTEIEIDISTIAAVSVTKMIKPETNVVPSNKPDKPIANMRILEKNTIMPDIRMFEDAKPKIASDIPNTNLFDNDKPKKKMVLSISVADANHAAGYMDNTIVSNTTPETIADVLRSELAAEPSTINAAPIEDSNIEENAKAVDAIHQFEVLKTEPLKVDKVSQKNKKPEKKYQQLIEPDVQCRKNIIPPANNYQVLIHYIPSPERAPQDVQHQNQLSSQNLVEEYDKIPTIGNDNCYDPKYFVPSNLVKFNLDYTIPLLPEEGLSKGPGFEHSIRRMIKRSLMIESEEEKVKDSLIMLPDKATASKETKHTDGIPNYGYYGKSRIPAELLKYWSTRVEMPALDEFIFECNHCASMKRPRHHDPVFCESCSANGRAQWCDNKCRYEDTFHWKICGIANYKYAANYNGFGYDGPVKSMKTLNWRRYWQSTVLHDYPRFDYVIFDMGAEHKRMQIKHGIVIRNQFLRVRVYALFRRAFWDHDTIAVDVLFRVIKSFVSVMGLRHITHDNLRWQFAEEFGSKVDYKKYAKDFAMPNENEWHQVEQHLSRVLREEGFVGIHPFTPKLPCISKFPPVPDYMRAHMDPGSYPEGGV